MTRQHTVCLNTVILQQLIANSQHTMVQILSTDSRDSSVQKFLPDEEFSGYDQVFVSPERITNAYYSCLHSIWTPTVLPENVTIESSSEEQMEKEDEPDFWRQPPPTETHAFMSSIWKDMKKILRGHIRLRKQMKEQTARLE